MTFAGAVLCGGRSRRMGQDKALLRLDGVAMAARVAAALEKAGATAVVGIGGDADALSELGLRVVPDDHPGGGPLPATITALERAEAPIVVVLSCDLLAPDPHLIRTLVDALDAAPPSTAAAIPVADGVPQWTHAAWRPSAADDLRAARAAGSRSLRRATDGLDRIELGGLDPRHLADADRPEDLPEGSGPASGAG
jgi:molybdopterin-guanine dinucleotide biosynthesis protein A